MIGQQRRPATPMRLAAGRVRPPRPQSALASRDVPQARGYEAIAGRHGRTMHQPLALDDPRRIHAEGGSGWPCDGLLVNGVDRWVHLRAESVARRVGQAQGHQHYDRRKAINDLVLTLEGH